jgi:hypothetical protein
MADHIFDSFLSLLSLISHRPVDEAFIESSLQILVLICQISHLKPQVIVFFCQMLVFSLKSIQLAIDLALIDVSIFEVLPKFSVFNLVFVQMSS